MGIRPRDGLFGQDSGHGAGVTFRSCLYDPTPE